MADEELPRPYQVRTPAAQVRRTRSGASFIERMQLYDDDGTGEVGTVLNDDWLQRLYNEIDDAFDRFGGGGGGESLNEALAALRTELLDAMDAKVAAAIADLATSASVDSKIATAVAPLATTASVDSKITTAKSEVQTWVGTQGYATQTWVTSQSYATQTWVTSQNYATQTWVTSQNYATQTWVTDRGYQTLANVQALGYTTLAAVQTWVNNQGFGSTSALQTWITQQGYTTLSAVQSWVNGQGFGSTSALQTWVTQQGYTTAAAALSAAQGWVNSQAYATQAWINANFYPASTVEARIDQRINEWHGAWGSVTSSWVSANFLPITPRASMVDGSVSAGMGGFNVQPNVDAQDYMQIWGLNGYVGVLNPAGSYRHGQQFILQIRSDGAERTIGWGDNWMSANAYVGLPGSTGAGAGTQIMTMGFRFNAYYGRWQMLSLVQGGY